MNVKVISRNVGLALLVSSLFMLLSVFVSVANGNDSALAALAISFVITFISGIFPFIFVRRAENISLSEGYMIITLSWLLSFVFGMLPYLLWGGPFTAVNAWFESVSGFTTTGSTILERVEDLPDSLLFWRASTHFIGGLGVVVFLLMIVPLASPVKLRLSNMELSSLSKEGYRSRANKTVYIFSYVYLAMNLAAFFSYWIAGMTPFDAICHAFSVCATGGFSTRSASIASFHSIPITIVSMVFMFLSSIHFGLIYISVVTRSFKPFRNPVLKFYAMFLVIASILVAGALRTDGIVRSWGSALLDGSFHVLSYASTTGFAIADNAGWPFLCTIILQICGICCGMAGSTTGGVKADRVLLLWKAIRQQVYRSLNPSSVAVVKVGNKVVTDEELRPHILYIAHYFFLLFVSVVVCLLFGVDNDNAFAATLSSLGNVGPAFGDLGTFGNYNAEPVMAKIFYTLDMFIGRVEIYPVLAVMSMIFSRNKKVA